MKQISRLPDSVALQYTELMQQCIQPAPDGANLSFKSKTIGRKRYWYLYISLGTRRTEHYLGEETPVLLDTIENEKALWSSTEDDRAVRARLVAMLLAGGDTGPTRQRREGSGVDGTLRRLSGRWGGGLGQSHTQPCKNKELTEWCKIGQNPT